MAWFEGAWQLPQSESGPRIIYLDSIIIFLWPHALGNCTVSKKRAARGSLRRKLSYHLDMKEEGGGGVYLQYVCSVTSWFGNTVKENAPNEGNMETQMTWKWGINREEQICTESRRKKDRTEKLESFELVYCMLSDRALFEISHGIPILPYPSLQKWSHADYVRVCMCVCAKRGDPSHL